MIYGLWLSAAGGMSENQRTQSIANNLANVNTPGFKRNISIFRQRETEIREDVTFPKHVNKVHEQVGGGMLVHESYTDLSRGAIVHTANNFDVAIESGGYFAVKPVGAPAGDPETPIFYTRAGNFDRDSRGALVTQDRQYEVLDRDMLPIRIEENVKFTVTREGAINIGGEEVGSIGIFEFDDDSVLEKRGENLFTTNGLAAAQPVPPIDVELKQGHLELSGANPITEMVEMISAFRGFEANMRLIRNQDSTLARAVSDLGRVPG